VILAAIRTGLQILSIALQGSCYIGFVLRQDPATEMPEVIFRRLGSHVSDTSKYAYYHFFVELHQVFITRTNPSISAG
jgi:hypothetical protein